MGTPHWSDRFKYDLYDWGDPEWQTQNRDPHGFRPILISRGYFMMVSRTKYRQMMQKPGGSEQRWTINIQRHPETKEITAVYAYRRGRKGEGRQTVYAHQEITGTLGLTGVVDHKNGWGLDNRGDSRNPVNLCWTSFGMNRLNHNGVRTKNRELPTGVLPLKNGMYKGRIFVRIGKRRRPYDSKRSWHTPGPAARWYPNQLKQRHKRTAWVHNPDSVSWPIFPPLLESDMSERSWEMRQKKRAQEHVDEIPF